MPSLSTRNAYTFSKQISDQLGAIPSSATDLTTTDTVIYQLHVTNTTGGALTLTILDKQATPRNLFTAYSIAANNTLLAVWPEGILLKGGMRWSGSGSGLEGNVIGWYK